MFISVNVKLDHLAEVVFVRFLHYSMKKITSINKITLVFPSSLPYCLERRQ